MWSSSGEEAGDGGKIWTVMGLGAMWRRGDGRRVMGRERDERGPDLALSALPYHLTLG